jgi:hypothetical protein
MYTGEISMNSNDLIDLLQLCQEYLVPKLKQSIEIVFSENISIDNFADLMMVSRAYDALHLRKNLIAFGK